MADFRGSKWWAWQGLNLRPLRCQGRATSNYSLESVVFDVLGERTRAEQSGNYVQPYRAFAALGIALALAGCKVEHGPPPPSALEIAQHEQNANAGYMLRLGYGRWVAACGYEAAKKGRSRKDAVKDCGIDFHFTGPITGVP